MFGTGTMPVLAIIDPELMTSVPASFKAYQGFDALFHSNEGYISSARNEFSKNGCIGSHYQCGSQSGHGCP